MARQALPINLADMQSIISVEEKNYNGGIIEFYQHCCDIYNKKNNPAKPIYGQIIYNYVRKGGLTTSFNANKKKVLSPEHIAKLQAGRKSINQTTTDTPKIIKNPHNRPEINELSNLIDEINRQSGKNYQLNIHYDINARETQGNIYFSDNIHGPCLYWKELKWYMIGLANTLGVDLYMNRKIA